MATSPLIEFRHHLRHSLFLREGADQTDGQLLEAFINSGTVRRWRASCGGMRRWSGASAAEPWPTTTMPRMRFRLPSLSWSAGRRRSGPAICWRTGCMAWLTRPLARPGKWPRGLIAQPAVSPPKRSGNDQVFQLGDIRVPALNEEQIRQLAINQIMIEKLPKMKMLEVESKKVAPPEWAHWHWLLILALRGGLGGGWGTKQILSKQPCPAADSPKPRVDRMGLGADGKGGVWLREVAPWEM